MAEVALKAEITGFDVLRICTAYEQGVGKGADTRPVPANPYAEGIPERRAWDLGLEQGREILSGTEAKKNDPSDTATVGATTGISVRLP